MPGRRWVSRASKRNTSAWEASGLKLYRDFSTQEEIDAQYNPEASVPDLPLYIEFFVGESERARNELDCALDQAFGPTVDETVDIFPAASPGAPVVVLSLIHI